MIFRRDELPSKSHGYDSEYFMPMLIMTVYSIITILVMLIVMTVIVILTILIIMCSSISVIAVNVNWNALHYVHVGHCANIHGDCAWND